MIICLPPLCKSCLEVSAAVSSSFCSFFSLSSLTVCALVRLLSSHTRNDVSDLLFLVCTFTCSLSLSSLSLSPVESEHTRVIGGNLLAVVIAPADGHEIIMFVFNICQRERESERERESIWTHSISTAAATGHYQRCSILVLHSAVVLVVVVGARDTMLQVLTTTTTTTISVKPLQCHHPGGNSQSSHPHTHTIEVSWQSFSTLI